MPRPPGQRLCFTLGIAAILIAALPTFGADGGGSMVIPNSEEQFPHFDILPDDPLGLYTAASIPLHLLALVPYVDLSIYSHDTNVHPLVMMTFWSVVGIGLIWSAVRPPLGVVSRHKHARNGTRRSTRTGYGNRILRWAGWLAPCTRFCGR